MRALICGAGIGGLTTALALHQHNIEVRIFESADSMRALGVGINLLPHAVRVLTNLGLADELAQTGIPTAELAYYTKRGERIWSEPRGLAAGYLWPQYSIHRGRLLELLWRAVTARLGPQAITTAHHLQSIDNAPNQVTAHFLNRHTNTPQPPQSGDILIGADGIHSVARHIFYPNEGDPKFSGRLLWRAVSAAPPFLTGRSMIMAGHADQKFVCYPIGNGLINWIAERNLGAGAHLPRRDWNRLGDKSSFAPEFETWRFPFLDVPALIASAPEVYEFPMVDRDPVPQWSFGRATLLGDAAHPMYPIGSNGASQAILDADALATAVTENPNPIDALKTYEAARLAPTAQIVHSNRQHGPEVVMQIVEERAPNGFENLHDVITQSELETIAQSYKRTAGFDRDTLNQSK